MPNKSENLSDWVALPRSARLQELSQVNPELAKEGPVVRELFANLFEAAWASNFSNPEIDLLILGVMESIAATKKGADIEGALEAFNRPIFEKSVKFRAYEPLVKPAALQRIFDLALEVFFVDFEDYRSALFQPEEIELTTFDPFATRFPEPLPLSESSIVNIDLDVFLKVSSQSEEELEMPDPDEIYSGRFGVPTKENQREEKLLDEQLHAAEVLIDSKLVRLEENLSLHYGLKSTA